MVASHFSLLRRRWAHLGHAGALVVVAGVLLAGCVSTGSASSTPTVQAALPTSALATQAKIAPSQTTTPAAKLASTLVPRISPEPEVAAPSGQAVRNPELPADAALFAGNWRVYSSRLFYDQGGGGSVTSGAGTGLEIAANGAWKFGTSTGTWSVGASTAADWKRWGIDPYGPTRKITMLGWNGSTADGPVEESAGRIDFAWVIYRTGPPAVGAPGTVWMKFGHP